MKSRIRNIIIFAAFLILMVVLILVFFVQSVKEISYTDFLNKINEGQVSHIYVDGYNAKVRYESSNILTTDFPNRADAKLVISGYVSIGEIVRENNINAKLYEDAVEDAGGIEYLTDEELAEISKYEKLVVIDLRFSDPNSGSILSTLIPLLSLVLLAVFAIIIFRNLGGGSKQAMNFSKSKARLNANIKVKFSDVAGAEEEKQELAEIVEFLKNPKKFETVGARIPKGVLLVGPPGTGKTLFAKAVAGEANVPFFSISGSDFVEMFVGVGASRVRELFEEAKRNMPCIVFIDEIDAVGRQRGTGMGGGHDEREQTLNQLLVQMDGFETNSGIIIMAATNRADILDPALLRPGRFDRQVYVHLPDVRGREAIFRVHSRNKPIAADVDFKILGRITSGFSGADIETLLNEAAILAARDNRTVINMLDINEGIKKVVMGVQKKSRIVTEVDKRITAYHEAGHAIIAKLLPNCDPVHEVSIIQRGHAAGYTMTRPDNDDRHVSKAKLTDDIAMTMGGRAAEEIVIQDFTTGASQDIKVATGQARRMVTEWGMGALGPVYLGGEQEVFLGRDYQTTHSYSDEVAAKIDAEIYRIVEQGHQTAVKLLTEKREIMDKMVRLLIEKETIYSEEVDALMAGKDVASIAKEMDLRLERRAESVKNAVSGNKEVTN